jgi:hypothetical protein
LSYQILLRVEFKKPLWVELDPPQWKLRDPTSGNQETPPVENRSRFDLEIKDEKSRDPHSGKSVKI